MASSAVSEEAFQKVAKMVGAYDGSVSIGAKAKFYGYYKRATLGRLSAPFTSDDVDTDDRPASRPGMLSPTARSKYDAWRDATDKIATRAEAKQAYLSLAEETMGKAAVEEACA